MHGNHILTYFRLHWPPLGHLLEIIWHFFDTMLATLGTPWGQFSTSWIPFWLRRAPLGHHLGTPGIKSRKSAKKQTFWATFLDSFQEGCTCNPSTQAQSKHTFCHYFKYHFQARKQISRFLFLCSWVEASVAPPG